MAAARPDRECDSLRTLQIMQTNLGITHMAPLGQTAASIPKKDEQMSHMDTRLQMRNAASQKIDTATTLEIRCATRPNTYPTPGEYK